MRCTSKSLLWLLLGPATTSLIPCPVSATQQLEPQKSAAVIIGVLRFIDPGLSSFSPTNRKDSELFKALQRLGISANRMSLLLDQQARLAAIHRAIRLRARQVKPGGTLIIYYAGHGIMRPGGRVFLANYDLISKRAEQTGFAVASIAGLIQPGFRGTNVLLMGDSCYSGALKRVARQLKKRGVAAASVTSADSSNLSTGNWTFTQTVIDALTGDPLADHNRDRRTTLNELAREVALAMKHREHQRSGYSLHGVAGDFVLSKARSPISPVVKGRFKPGQYLKALYAGQEQPVRVLAVRQAMVHVQFYGYSRKVNRWLPPTHLKPFSFRRFKVGIQVQVRWSRKLYPAKILRVSGDFHRITYLGWPRYWDEWVMANRIVGPGVKPLPSTQKRGSIMVKWGGRWWPARILQRQGTRYLIHYIGYGNSWNEWVGPGRIRFPKP